MTAGRVMQKLSDAFRLIAFPVLAQRAIGDAASPFYHAFAELCGRAVIRETFLMEHCAGKRVLHFGFLDAPFTADRLRSGELLHARLMRTARSVFGADIIPEALEIYRTISGDRENMILDIQSAFDPHQFAGRFDLILFGEILEHLRNPGAALENLRAISLVNDGCEVCITTPNAFFLGGFLPALRAREIVHPEHYYYFSPATLHRLLADCGFGHVEMRFYSNRETLTSPGLTKAGLIATCHP